MISRADNELEYAGPEWSRQFMAAIRDATAQAIEKHLKAGNPVYFTDNNGEICELSPDKKVRKLSQKELEQLLAK